MNHFLEPDKNNINPSRNIGDWTKAIGQNRGRPVLPTSYPCGDRDCYQSLTPTSLSTSPPSSSFFIIIAALLIYHLPLPSSSYFYHSYFIFHVLSGIPVILYGFYRVSLKKVGFGFQACFKVFRGLRSKKFRRQTPI